MNDVGICGKIQDSSIKEMGSRNQRRNALSIIRPDDINSVKKCNRFDGGRELDVIALTCCRVKYDVRPSV